MKRLQSCVAPPGKFIYGIHKPSYTVSNLRQDTQLAKLGRNETDEPVDNLQNYPHGAVQVGDADWIYEIPNPFPFRGRTFIDKVWADNSASNPQRIQLPEQKTASLSQTLRDRNISEDLFTSLPDPVRLALATCSTDPADLTALARLCCEILMDGDKPLGLRYKQDGSGRLRAVIHDHELFEAVANNPNLPDEYKIVMVIRPGAQGSSEIVGEWPKSEHSHIYEYLRRNSYISGGHYAANMADDTIRYSIAALSREDIRGLRHLYYQRSFVRLATALSINLPATERLLTTDELESLRKSILERCAENDVRDHTTLWGWNFGFDYAPSRYRLHASHQQIHQQYAMIPATIDQYSTGCSKPEGTLATYGCGDLIADWIIEYRKKYQADFFADYLQAIRTNRRMDERSDLEANLVIWQDERVMLFVPKAQTSQWELQLITLPQGNNQSPGNIVECDSATRDSIDSGILIAQKTLAGLGAKMVTSIEFPKRIGATEQNQPLLYNLLPKLPESPGAFSEAQLRFINGHYPEDFAAALRKHLPHELCR